MVYPSPTRPAFSGEDSHNALLNSIVDSLSSELSDRDVLQQKYSDDSLSMGETSPATERRNRDLAEVLFGARSDEDEDDQETEKEIMPSSRKPVEPLQANKGKGRPQPPPIPPTNTTTSAPVYTPPALSPSYLPPIVTVPYPPSRNHSSPRLPSNPQEEAELANEIRRKADAAMVALKKQPSHTNLSDTLSPVNGSARRKVKPGQISTPTLVSSTTSLDTVPLPIQPTATGGPPGPSKLGSRFKKFRGTLRKAPVHPTGEEVTPFPLDYSSATSASPATSAIGHDRSQTLPANQSQYDVTAGSSARASQGTPNPSGPGLKGFMARFRSRPRHEEEGRNVPSPLPLPSLNITSPAAPKTLHFKCHFLVPAR
jgi:serine/arginine repetitive matrix protein 2